mmetsp:Transcript_122737/g.393091  ORF Transcript_122737/g.393091 Transcript_122737/m.393091 type:complete len:480 (+) Transcript_122737:4349-5788(+)
MGSKSRSSTRRSCSTLVAEGTACTKAVDTKTKRLEPHLAASCATCREAEISDNAACFKGWSKRTSPAQCSTAFSGSLCGHSPKPSPQPKCCRVTSPSTATTSSSNISSTLWNAGFARSSFKRASAGVPDLRRINKAILEMPSSRARARRANSKPPPTNPVAPVRSTAPSIRPPSTTGWLRQYSTPSTRRFGRIASRSSLPTRSFGSAAKCRQTPATSAKSTSAAAQACATKAIDGSQDKAPPAAPGATKSAAAKATRPKAAWARARASSPPAEALRPCRRSAKAAAKETIACRDSCSVSGKNTTRLMTSWALPGGAGCGARPMGFNCVEEQDASKPLAVRARTKPLGSSSSTGNNHQASEMLRWPPCPMTSVPCATSRAAKSSPNSLRAASSEGAPEAAAGRWSLRRLSSNLNRGTEGRNLKLAALGKPRTLPTMSSSKSKPAAMMSAAAKPHKHGLPSNLTTKAFTTRLKNTAAGRFL